MMAYVQAILDARDLVDVAIGGEQNEAMKRNLVAMRPALFDDSKLSWEQW
jgi:hypothetical protein